jgi:hypothetical protein
MAVPGPGRWNRGIFPEGNEKGPVPAILYVIVKPNNAGLSRQWSNRLCESVPLNALVFTEPIRSRMSAIQETIEIRSGKYVGRFWSSSAFSNPQKVCLIRTSAYFGSPGGLVCCCKTYERHLDTVEVWGSSPHGPTIVFNHLGKILRKLHL